MTNMKDMSVVELKAMAYDLILQKLSSERQLQIVENEIGRQLKEIETAIANSIDSKVVVEEKKKK